MTETADVQIFENTTGGDVTIVGAGTAQKPAETYTLPAHAKVNAAKIPAWAIPALKASANVSNTVI